MPELIVEPTQHRVFRLDDQRRNRAARRRMRVAHIQTSTDGLRHCVEWISKRFDDMGAAPAINAEDTLERYKGQRRRFQIELLITYTFPIAAVREVARCQVILKLAQQPVEISFKPPVRF